MDWLIFDVDGVLLDVSDSFDIAVKKTVENILDKFNKKIDIKLDYIRCLRNKGIFSDDFELSKTLILGKLEFDSIRTFMDNFPEKETVDWIEDHTEFFISNDSVKRVFNSYYLGNNCEDSLFDSEPLYKREKKIVDLKLITEMEMYYNFGVITGRDDKEMKLAEKIIGYNFENVVTRDYLKKPDPNCLEKLLGIDEGIYIGDTEVDRMMVEKFNKKHENQVRFFKVTRNNNVNKILKKIKESGSGKV